MGPIDRLADDEPSSMDHLATLQISWENRDLSFAAELLALDRYSTGLRQQFGDLPSEGVQATYTGLSS